MRWRHLLPINAILPSFAPLAPTPARADVFGYTVLLCMLNPGGWASVPACIQPVQAANNPVARRRFWPQCPEANMSAQSPSPGMVDNTSQEGTQRIKLDTPARP